MLAYKAVSRLEIPACREQHERAWADIGWSCGRLAKCAHTALSPAPSGKLHTFQYIEAMGVLYDYFYTNIIHVWLTTPCRQRQPESEARRAKEMDAEEGKENGKAHQVGKKISSLFCSLCFTQCDPSSGFGLLKRQTWGITYTFAQVVWLLLAMLASLSS